MSDSTVILNARLPQRPGLYQISIQGGMIEAVNKAGLVPVGAAATVLDIAGDWLTLGAVDLQINGALGLAFPDLRSHHLPQLGEICELLWQQGVDEFCPTLVTTSPENFQGSLAALQTFVEQQNVEQQGIQQTGPAVSAPSFSTSSDYTGRARVLGAHLEGPFLNEAKRGAHPAEHLQPLTLAGVKALLAEFASTVSIMTLAPELAMEAGVIEWLRSHQITVSLGHSLARTASPEARLTWRGPDRWARVLRIYCRWAAYLPNHAGFAATSGA